MPISLAPRGVATFRDSDGKVIVFAEGRGPYVRDTRGRDYVDLVCGYGPVVLGHADADFTARICASIAQGIHFPGYATIHEEYLDHLASGVASDSYSAAYFRSSSEAVTAGLRVAAVRTGRLGVVRCGFIGWHDVQIAESPRWHESLRSPLRQQRRSTGSAWRGVTGREAVDDWLDLDLHTLAALLGRHADRIGALVVDAYQLELADALDLGELLAVCRSHGVMLILDETKTAGRVHQTGVFAKADVFPDMVVLGKAIANGAPLSLLLFDRSHEPAYMDARVGGTYSKETSAVGAGLATLRLMHEKDGWTGLARAGRAVAALLNDSLAASPAGGAWRFDTRFNGAMLDIAFGEELIGDLTARNSVQQCYADAGVLLLQGHPSFPSLALAEVDMARLADAAAIAVEAFVRTRRT